MGLVYLVLGSESWVWVGLGLWLWCIMGSLGPGSEQEAELCFIDFRDESCSQEGDGGDEDLGEEGEEFECYPPGMKVQVRYGRGRSLKTYQATVKEADVEGGEVLYLVHYCGWNVR